MPHPELETHVAELKEATGLAIEVFENGNRLFIVIGSVPLPPNAYRVAATDVLFIADRQYPTSALDMFWTGLEVLRQDGTVPRSAQVEENYLGRRWRRFSWHPGRPARPARNPLLDHYAFVEARFTADESK